MLKGMFPYGYIPHVGIESKGAMWWCNKYTNSINFSGSCSLDYRLVQVPSSLRGSATDNPVFRSLKCEPSRRGGLMGLLTIFDLKL